MKRELIGILTGLVVAASAFAGPNMLQWTDEAWNTNSSDTAENPDTDVYLSGYVHAIILDVTAGLTFTGTVSVTTEASGSTGASRTILTDTDVSADETWYPRDIADTTAGAAIANTPEKIPLVMDKVNVELYSAIAADGSGATGITAKVYLILSGDSAP